MKVSGTDSSVLIQIACHLLDILDNEQLCERYDD